MQKWMPAPKAMLRKKRARWIEAVGVLPARRIAVGGGEQQPDLLALLELDALDLDRLQRIAVEEVQRRIEAQRLLADGGG